MLVFTNLFIIPIKFRDFRDYIVSKGLLNLSYLNLINKLYIIAKFKLLNKTLDTTIILVNSYS